MRWARVTKFDPRAAALADRHYTRQTPGSDQFMPSGRTIVLLTDDALAVWGTHWAVGGGVLWSTHDWPRAWNCSIFRNEGPHLSSDLIREAVAATRALWGDPTDEGFITFVDRDKVRPKRDPGRCFLRAGFRFVGYTRSGKVALQLAPADFPDPDPPTDSKLPLFWPDEEPFVAKRDVFGGQLRRLA
jgi:hypothetical protein